MNYQDILSFWFTESTPEQWFTKDLAFDETIRRRFEDVHRQAIACELSAWRKVGAQGRLAEIIVIDQFSRNLFRDDPRQFAADPMALVLAQEAIALGLDQQLTPEQRVFLYLPFMHSESRTIHIEAVRLYTALGIAGNLEFEYKHKAIIDRFGRYPHRNAVLGRVSTPEEIEFLTEPNSHF
ncbi:DUF924 family protein [Aquirhabdus sp.]|uniref:DUF924 family protein n=1 Tax=Aquirhabdus sp. TaxID=2824160 RepID=UPI00396C80E2